MMEGKDIVLDGLDSVQLIEDVCKDGFDGPMRLIVLLLPAAEDPSHNAVTVHANPDTKWSVSYLEDSTRGYKGRHGDSPLLISRGLNKCLPSAHN